jgi:hypothetical protein
MPSTLDLLEIGLQHLDSKPPITTRVLRGTINPSFSAQDDVARLTPRYYAASLSVSSRSPKHMDWHYLGNSGFSRMDPSVRYLQGCFVAMNCDIKYNLTRVPNHSAQV